MAGLQVLSAPTQPALNPVVQSAPTQPRLAPTVSPTPIQPVPATLPVVTQPQQPTLAPQVQGQPANQGNIASVGPMNQQQPVTQKLTLDEFAQAIKQQFPQYADKDNATLAQAMLAKYPQYQDRIIAPSTDQGPLPEKSTAANLGLGVLKGAAHTGDASSSVLGKFLNPVADFISKTLGTAYDKVTGSDFKSASSKTIPNLTPAAPTGVAQKIGFAAEQLAEFFAIPDAGAGKAVTDIPAVANLVENSPKAATAIRLGTKAVQEGVNNLAFGQFHGSDSPKTDLAIGAAAPIIGHGLSAAWESLPKLIQKGTGLSDEIVQQAVDNRPLFLQALKDVAKNPTSPYNQLAHEVSSAMVEGETEVKTAYKAGLDAVKKATEGQTFNVSPQIDDFNKVLKGYGIETNLVRGADGTLTKDLAIIRTPQLQLPEPQLKIIDDLVNSVRQSTDVNFDQLTQLQQKVSNAYNEVPYGVNHTPTVFHSIIGKLSDVLDKKVEQVAGKYVPAMDKINSQYADYKQVFKAFGNKFIDRTDSKNPTIASSAESFLSNLLNKNKLAQQGNVAKKLEEFTGISILDRAQSLKAADQLARLQASGKANAVQKFLKTTGGAIGGTVGLHLGGIPGAAGGAGAGYEIGKVAGKFATPEAGITAIRAQKAIGNKAASAVEKLPTVVKGIGKNVSDRFLR